MNTEKNHIDLALELSNVGVYYTVKKSFWKTSKYWALKDISLKLKRGETLGVIGKNGVGKSTLLRAMSGLINPDRGTITTTGLKASLLTLNLGYMSQLSGRDNAVLGGLYAGLSRNEIVKRLPSIEEMADIGEFFNQPIYSFSSGMRARLGFSIAIHCSPDILLIDEILGVGDYEFKKKSSEIIKEKIKSNLTVVLVSHQTSVVEDLCDRVMWIEQGSVKKIGQTDTVIKAYLR